MTGKDAETIRGGHLVCGNVLQGGGTSDSIFWLRVVGPFSSNGKYDIRDAHRVTTIDHMEVSASESIRDVADTGGGGSSGDSRDSVRGHVH